MFRFESGIDAFVVDGLVKAQYLGTIIETVGQLDRARFVFLSSSGSSHQERFQLAHVEIVHSRLGSNEITVVTDNFGAQRKSGNDEKRKLHRNFDGRS